MVVFKCGFLYFGIRKFDFGIFNAEFGFRDFLIFDLMEYPHILNYSD